MTGLVLLQDLVAILAGAVVVVAVLRQFRVPSIAAFIVAGAAIGPHALGLVQDHHQVELLAEFGVVLLLFGIGLELSLDRVRTLWRPILVGGALQVGLSIVAVLAVALLLGMRTPEGLALGFIVAVSSTAIVLRGLAERGELEAPHGRLALGILIFQDLCVVPMILLIPVLADSGSEGGVWGPVLRAVAVIVGVLAAARLLVPRLLDLVARTRQRDLFVLTVFLICLGTAWLVSLAGVSIALGGFLAGLVVSGSHYREQAIADLVPLRDVLASLFFVSIGMLLDTGEALDQALPISLLFVGIVAGKFVIVFLTASLLRLPLRVAVLTAAALSQVGEFSFVLLQTARSTALLQDPLVSNLTVAVILSMLVTPFGLALGPHLALGLSRLSPLTRLFGVQTTAEMHDATELRDHVIVAGLGVTGRSLAAALAARGVPHVIVDINIDNVRRAVQAGQPACFGDVTNAEVLEHLGIRAASDLVLAINDPDALIRVIRLARSESSSLRITARTAYEVDVPRLVAAGATHVVAAEGAAARFITDRVIEDLERSAPAQ